MTKKVSYREYLYKMGMHDVLIFLFGEESFNKRVKYGRIWWDDYNTTQFGFINRTVKHL